MYPIANELKVGNNQLDSYLPVRNKNNEILAGNSSPVWSLATP